MMIRTGAALVCVAATVLTLGCGDSKKGKFTEEQMRHFPLANRYDLPEATGGMVMSLFSETITADEILLAVEERLMPAAAQMDRQTFFEQTRPLFRQTVRSKVADILLYEEARKKAPENIDEVLDKAVEQEIHRFVASYGNNYALAEATIRKMGMDWRTFRQYQKKMLMTQSYLSQKLDEKVRFTHSQMTAYYDAHRDELFCRAGMVEFYVIDILPKLLDADVIGEGQTASQAAMELATALAARARTGEDFAALAKQYSHGPLAASGGKWLPVTLGADALPEPYDVLEAEAVKLQPDQVSDPIVSADHIFVMKLTAKDIGGCKSFAEVQPMVEQQLLFQRRQKQYDDFVSELIKQADFVEMERFAEFCINTAYDRWKAS